MTQSWTRLARRMARKCRDSEDFAQEIFLYLWRHFPDYDPDGALSFWCWTLYYARACLLSVVKQQAARAPVNVPLDGQRGGADVARGGSRQTDSDLRAEGLSDRVEHERSEGPHAVSRRLDVRAAVRALAPEDRELVRRRYVLEERPTDIARGRGEACRHRLVRQEARILGELRAALAGV